MQLYRGALCVMPRTDYFAFSGDNVYGDCVNVSNNCAELEAAYAGLKQHGSFSGAARQLQLVWWQQTRKPWGPGIVEAIAAMKLPTMSSSGSDPNNILV